MDNTTFIDSMGHHVKHSTMKDEHQLIRITEKTPVPKDIGKIVCGDTNSNILTFETNRYYDGVDLFTKRIKIIVRNELGLFTEDTVNLQYNDELLRFSWILSDAVTCKSGIVTAAIAFIGWENGYKYTCKSLPFTIKVENSLDLDPSLDPDQDPPEETPEPPYKNWFTDIECRLQELERGSSDLDQGFANLGQDFKDLDQGFSDLKQDFANLDQSLSDLKQDSSNLDQSLSDLKQDSSNLDQSLSDLKQDFADLHQDFADLEQGLSDFETEPIDFSDGWTDPEQP